LANEPLLASASTLCRELPRMKQNAARRKPFCPVHAEFPKR
jgi:hypothetical protein